MIVCLRTVVVPPEWHDRHLVDRRWPRHPPAAPHPRRTRLRYEVTGTFEVLIEDYHLGSDPALVRLAKIVHAADIGADLDTDPAGPGLLAIGLGGLDVETDDQRLLDRGRFVYDALYAWCQRQVAAPV